MGLLPNAASQNIEIKFARGIDGENSIVETAEGFAIDVVNADISLPHLAQKRVGYNAWGCDLPVRAVAYNNSAQTWTLESQVIETPVTLTLSTNNGTLLASIGSEFAAFDDQLNTCVGRFTNNRATIDKNTLIAVSGSGYLFAPVHIYNNEYVLFPRRMQDILGAYNGACTILNGLSLPFIDESQITSITMPTTSTVELTPTVDTTLPLFVGSRVFFETGLRRSGGGPAPIIGRVSNIVSGVVTITLAPAEIPFSGNVTANFFRMRYLNSQTLVIEGKDLFDFSDGPPTIFDLNVLRIVPTSGFSTQTNSWFIYGTGINVGAVTLLNAYTTETINDLVVGYAGNVFVEKPTVNGFTSFSTFAGSRTAADQSLTDFFDAEITITVANSLFNDSVLKVQAGDIVYWSLKDGTNNSADRSEYLVLSSTLTTITVLGLGLTALFIPAMTQINYSRVSSRIYVSQVNGGNYSLWVGRTVRVNHNTFSSPHHSIVHVVWPGLAETTARYVELDSAVEWTSEDSFNLIRFFAPVYTPDIQKEVRGILPPDYFDTVVDMQSEQFDFSLYAATYSNGTWRYNGQQIVSCKLFSPPTPLARNIRGSGGTLRIVQGEDNVRVGRRYNFIITYSYFENVDGVSRKIESGITPETDVSIVAQPALDGSLGSQRVEIQVASVPRGIGLPADTMFINVYRTLEGIDESGIDGGQYLLERSIRNNPNQGFVTIVVGDVPEFDFSDSNADRLYTTIQSQASGNLPNNAPAPDSKYLANFSNRLLALNCATTPSLTLECQKAFEIVGGTFSAFARLAIKQQNVAVARLVTARLRAANINDQVDFGGGDISNSYSLRIESLAVSAVEYDDLSHTFNLASITIGTQNIVACRFVSNSRTPASTYSIDIEGQTFKYVSVGKVRSLKQRYKNGFPTFGTVMVFAGNDLRAGDVISAPTATKGFFIQTTGLIQQDTMNNIADILAQPLYIERDNIDSTTIGSNEFFVVHGLGTSLQILDGVNGRAYDLDREIVFQRIGTVGVNKMKVKLFVIESGKLTFLERFYLNIVVTNQSGGVQNPQFAILKLITSVTGSGKDYLIGTPDTITNLSVSPTLATITTTTAHPISVVTAESFVCLSSLGQFPSNIGINFDGTFKVTDFLSAFELRIIVEPSDRIWRSSLEGSSESTRTSLTGRAVFPEQAFVKINDGLEILVEPLIVPVANSFSPNCYAFIYAAGADAGSHSLQLSGYFKVLAFYRPFEWISATTIDNPSVVQRVRIQIDNNALNYEQLSSLAACRIMIMPNAFLLPGQLGDIPIPVPVSRNEDVAGPMFSANPADTTPLSKVIKRFALAINSIFGSVGYAYWGSAVTSNSEPFPANGFKFLARSKFYSAATFATTPFLDATEITFALTSRRDTQIPGEKKSTYLLNGASSVANTSDTFSTGETLLTQELNTNRVYWTDAAAIELSNTMPSFKDNANFKDLPSADGEAITGVKVFQNFILIFKPNGIFRGQFNGDDLIVERVQSSVGSLAYKNIVNNEDGCYFVHSSGVYITDGYAVTPVMKLKEPFRKFVQPNSALFRQSAGIVDNVSKQVILGVPYSDTTKSDNQLVFTYFDNVKGWTRNTQFDARWWAKRNNRRYFAGNDGHVYVVRYEDGPTKYRDGVLSIPFRLATAFLSTASNLTYKFFREMILQFGAEANSTIGIKYLTNYNLNETTLETFTVEANGYGYEPYGISAYGGDGEVKQIRRSVLPNRAQQVAFVVENDVIDQNIQVYNVSVAAEMGGNTMTKQNRS